MKSEKRKPKAKPRKPRKPRKPGAGSKPRKGSSKPRTASRAGFFKPLPEPDAAKAIPLTAAGKRDKRYARTGRRTVLEVKAAMKAARDAPADWPQCPGCGAAFPPRTGWLLINNPLLYQHWANAPCCSATCRLLVQLLGPIDQALLDPYQAVNTNLGRLLVSVAGRLRRNMHAAKVAMVQITEAQGETLPLPYLDEPRRDLLRARARQLLTIARAVYNHRGKLDTSRKKQRKPEKAASEAATPALPPTAVPQDEAFAEPTWPSEG